MQMLIVASLETITLLIKIEVYKLPIWTLANSILYNDLPFRRNFEELKIEKYFLGILFKLIQKFPEVERGIQVSISPAYN